MLGSGSTITVNSLGQVSFNEFQQIVFSKLLSPFWLSLNGHNSARVSTFDISLGSKQVAKLWLADFQPIPDVLPSTEGLQDTKGLLSIRDSFCPLRCVSQEANEDE